MRYELTDVVAPTYAPSGEQGYQLRATRTGDYGDGTGRVRTLTTTLHGWISRGPDGAVHATLDRSAWQDVATVDAAEWGAEWVRANASAVLAAVRR